MQVGGNLVVQGTTTQINTTTTVQRDKSIVLTQSEIKTGATYTAANPAVVTYASHGLNNDDVIFVVSSTEPQSYQNN